MAERLGLGYERLRELNPRLVYASGSGYGTLGPDSDLPSLDGAAQARSGLMYATGPDEADPYPLQGVIADQIGGITLAWGILAALVARSIHGVGQRVDVSHLSSAMWLQGLAVSMGLLTGHKPDSTINLSSNPRRESAYNPLANYYRCRDGRWIMLANFQADRYWPTFARAVGLGHLVDAPRFTDTAARAENRVELVQILDGVFEQKTYEEWAGLLRASGDFIFAPVQRLAELERDPQVVANDYIVSVDHPTLGRHKAGRPSRPLQRHTSQHTAAGSRAGRAHRGGPAGAWPHLGRHRAAPAERGNSVTAGPRRPQAYYFCRATLISCGRCRTEVGPP